MEIQETILKLLLKEPFYGHIASKLTIKKDSKIKKIQLNVYPQLVLYYNYDWFNKLNDDMKYGVILHELIHIVLQHPMRRGSRDKQYWAVACDLAVNQYIDPIYKDDSWIDIEIVALELDIKIQYWQSSEYYYDLLKKMKINVTGASTGGEALITFNNKEFKSDLIPDQDLNKNSMSLLKTITSQSINTNGSNLEGLNDLYSDYLLDWREVLKKFLSTKGKRDKKKSYKKVSRRFDGYPGNIYNKGLEALIALDESGSMPNSFIDIYLKELKEINKITGVKIKIVRFDTECSTPVPLKQYIEEKGRLKQGSTNFTPIFEIADQLKIPIVIIFTDGKGICPESVNQKVLWLLTKDGENPSNFGEVMYFTH